MSGGRVHVSLSQQGLPDSVPIPLRWASLPDPGLPRRAMPTHVPTRRHTARPLVFGQEPTRLRFPAPQPTLDYACSQRMGEAE